jgi:hypothetical protein
MGIHLGRVGHIGIHVSDVDRSIDFYRISVSAPTKARLIWTCNRPRPLAGA